MSLRKTADTLHEKKGYAIFPEKTLQLLEDMGRGASIGNMSFRNLQMVDVDEYILLLQGTLLSCMHRRQYLNWHKMLLF